MYHDILASSHLTQSPRPLSEDAYYEAYAAEWLNGLRRARARLAWLFRAAVKVPRRGPRAASVV